MDHPRFKFAGLNFHKIDFDTALLELEELIRSGSSHMVNTVTAELVVRANEDVSLKNIYNNCSLLMLDSYVMFYAAKIFRKPASEPVNAARLMLSFFKVAEVKRYRIYLLGAREDILNSAVRNLKNMFPQIAIVGWHHGYFNIDNDELILENLRLTNPDVVLVAMTSPLKEIIADKYMKALSIPVYMGVGGAIDVIGGKTQLAPLWISKIGLEWFYRLCQEPRRMWKRYTITNIKFIWLLIRKELFRI